MKISERMQQPGSRSQLAVAASLLLLLPLLAALQYYWLDQLRAKEHEYKKTALRDAASRFSRDLNQEITRVYTAFLPGPPWQGDEVLTTLAESYDRWREAAAFPKFIKAVFVATGDHAGQLHLKRLDPESKQFTAVAWPAELTAWRDELQPYLILWRSRPPGPHAPAPPSHPSALPTSDVMVRAPAPQFLNGDIPALIMPLMEAPRIGASREFNRPLPLSRFALIALETRCLQQEVLPALTQRHLTEGGQLSYELVIVNRRQEPQIIYQTGSTAAAAGRHWDYAKADVSIGLFGFDLAEARRLWRSKMQFVTFSSGASVGVRREGRELQKREGVTTTFTAPPVLAMVGEPPSGELPGAWQMHIRHRAGSLEAAVTSVNRRNLVISFSILLLLAASVSLLMISSQRARRLAQQQMDFVAGISHELHTPIAVLDSAGYNLAKGVMKSDEQVKKYGHLIRQETRRLKEIVEQVLEFAGVQANRQRYDLLPTSIPRVIEEVLASSQPLLDEAGFQVEKNMPRDLPVVMADALALARAIQNLLNNAMKYSGDSRWIELRAEAVNQGREPMVQITVSDHGLGIPAAELPHIFQPFYRGDEARAAQIRGNGLGLSLVKNIIEAHGGSLSVSSQPGAGSAFMLSLPATTQASYQPSAHQLKAEPMSRLSAEGRQPL